MKISKEMNNQEIARLLRAISAAYEVKNENRFKIMAYDRAATAIEHATIEVKDLWDDRRIQSLPGIGSAISSHLDELFRRGRVSHFNIILKGLPPAMFELLELPGVGAKTAYKLCLELRIVSSKNALERLEKAARQGKVAKIEGFGEKSEKELLESIREMKKGRSERERMGLPIALNLARKFIDYLKKCRIGERIEPLGSLRRMTATVGDIDIAVATKSPKKAIDCFIKMPEVKKVLTAGNKMATVVHRSGREVDLMTMEPESFGALLQHFTGSKHHNIHLRELALKQGWSISQYGIKKFKHKNKIIKGEAGRSKIIKFKDENSFYKALGLVWIPPELREDMGEIESAQQNKLPNLVDLPDIKGDFHIHSNMLMETSHDEGESSMKTLVKMAINLNYEYLGFCEHNPSRSQHSDYEIIELIRRKQEEIEKLKYSIKKYTQNKYIRPVCVLNGLEIDIRPNGELAVPEKCLKLLDYAIASIHSGFRMTKREMTDRILRALSNPKVKILGHPIGRKIGKREGYELDWEEVFSYCKKYDKWLEINAWPDRLDLPDTLVREAVKNRVKMVINTDSHYVGHMEYMKFGVSVARRGWAEKGDIINTLSCGKIKKLMNLK